MMVAVPAAGNRGVRAQAVPTLCIAKPDSGSCGPTGMGSREKRVASLERGPGPLATHPATNRALSGPCRHCCAGSAQDACRQRGSQPGKSGLRKRFLDDSRDFLERHRSTHGLVSNDERRRGFDFVRIA